MPGKPEQPPAQQSDKRRRGGYTTDAGRAGAGKCGRRCAYKAFFARDSNDAAKKIELGEAFILKYPESRYRSPVYGA